MKINNNIAYILCVAVAAIVLTAGLYHFPTSISPVSKSEADHPAAAGNSSSAFFEPPVSATQVTAAKPSSQPPQSGLAPQPNAIFAGARASSGAVAGQAGPVSAALGSNALIKLNGQDYQEQPDELGKFPELQMGAKQKVSVKVQFDGASAGDAVNIQVEDGGGLGPKGNLLAQHGTLDSQAAVNFDFTSGVQEGIYRITVMRGSDIKTLDFWVGPLPTPRPVASN